MKIRLPPNHWLVRPAASFGWTVEAAAAQPLRYATTMKALLILFLAIQASAESHPYVSFDPAPEEGIPAEAFRRKETKDLPEAHIVGNDVGFIKVKYFSPKVFQNSAQAISYLSGLVKLRKGTTKSHIFWAEGLGVPMIEALAFKTEPAGGTKRLLTGKGRKLLIWPGRAVYEDQDGTWWFTAWGIDDDKRLLKQ